MREERMKKGSRVLGSEGPREEKAKRDAKRKSKSDTELTEGGRRYTEKTERWME